MLIRVLGAGCKECDELYQNVIEAVTQLQLDAQVEKVEDLMEMVKLGVMTSPSVMIDKRLAVSGQVANVKSLVKIFSDFL